MITRLILALIEQSKKNGQSGFSNSPSDGHFEAPKSSPSIAEVDEPEANQIKLEPLTFFSVEFEVINFREPELFSLNSRRPHSTAASCDSLQPRTDSYRPPNAPLPIAASNLHITLHDSHWPPTRFLRPRLVTSCDLLQPRTDHRE